MKIDFSNKPAFLGWLAAVAVLSVLIGYGGATLPYLFHLRVPILSGLLLLFLPVICLLGLPTMLGNIFALNRWWKLALVTAGAAAVGLGIVLVGAVIGANADERFSLVGVDFLGDLADSESPWPYVLAALLALPTAFTAYWASGPYSQEMLSSERTRGAIAGALLSLAFFFAVYWLRSLAVFDSARQWLVGLAGLLPEGAQSGYLIDTNKGIEIAEGHAVLASYLLVAAALYLIGLVRYRPPTGDGRQLPVISYVLGLLQIFTLVLGLLTFWLDFYRVPVLLCLFAFSALAYYLWKVEHYYELKTCPTSPPATEALFAAVKARLTHQGAEKTLVVICASGGGIQAAGWTTQVLIRLQQRLGPDFTKAIGLISSVSGGSVGALHFLDRFDDGLGAPPHDKLAEIFDASTKESLGATGWGLVYPDLWRLLGLPFLTTQPRDRGKAVDLDWKSHLNKPQSTLRGWVDPVLRGKMPIPVFNATIVEDGRRYSLSPMSFGLKPVEGVEFNGLYPGCDIDASTAALLSATFPYVTPVTRNSRQPPNQKIFHVADGGYFDNYGIVAAIDFLEKILEHDQGRSIKNVLFVQIRAFPDEAPLQTAKDQRVGWKMALFGPIFTILDARNSTQGQRNYDDVQDLIKKWQGMVDIQDFKISFPKSKFFEVSLSYNGKQFLNQVQNKPPLSWMLTKKQCELIKQGWLELLKHADQGFSDAVKLIDAWEALQSKR
ncbi:patatin-like phospholipase family protein [Methylomonas rhizoryzae]|uniref:patatin-like phospholipase family protein n=1 Tax=Methylomonas rhizoryzae TaxID=2608981 RepID=UPI001231D757|nr:patatin-like phospholipase family protein [Methylomonas rhizoryzae]